jgi:Family of unknown function (DUF6279)
MITTFSAMRATFTVLWKRAAIIGLGLALLAGCSAVRLGYGQAPQLAWWWLDGYLDFNAEQAPRVRDALAQWFAWHRQTQLTDYAAALARARTEADGDLTPEQVCRWNDQLRERIDPLLEHILPAAAEIVLTLTPAQLAHLEKRMAKAAAKFRKEQLQADPVERREAATERMVERFESFYGRLDDPQRRLVAEAVASSPYDPQVWMIDRESRQRELLVTLRSLAADKPDAAKAKAQLRALARRFDGSPQGPLQAVRLRLAQHQCEMVARVHNSATLAQRQSVRRKLGGWEGDFRHLAGEARAPSLQAQLGSR